MQPATAHSLYNQLLALPEGLTGEILDSQIHTRPRPTGLHTGVESALQIELGGPGGCRILVEPEVHVVRDTEVCVPDLAGWCRGHLLQLPRDQRFDVVPDGVCEVLSPSTESKDRPIKMPLYARYGMAFAWLLDPLKRTPEAFAPKDGDWRTLGAWRGDDTVSVPPFKAVRLGLGAIWS